MTRQILLVASLSVVWLLLIGCAIWIMFPPTPEQQLVREFGKFRQLLIELDAPERVYAAQMADLVKASHGVDYNKLYQGIDLSTIDGINAARQRVKVFDEEMKRFGAIHEELWPKTKKIVNHNDLDEPYATRLKGKLSLDEADIYPKYRAVVIAAREDVEAVTHYLDVNEHYLGQSKWGDNSLSFSNPRVATDISKAQATLNAAEDRYERAARAAFQNRGNTLKFVQATMRDLEKTIRKLRADEDEDSKNDSR